MCSLCKNENLYSKEFVSYYQKLGIKKIIIYDNNENNGEKFEEALKEYKTNEKVEIIDIRGFESAQFPTYMDCYYKYGNQFDFLLFIDFDDFIKIENNIDINAYLYDENFKKCETIVLNWVMYGDNNLVKYDNRPMIERFTKPSMIWSKGKSIVRTNINKLIISSSHIIGINTKYFCDSNGNRIFPKTYHQFDIPNKPKAYIKHFYTKTAEEFCNKINKGDVHFPQNHPDYLKIIKEKIKTFFYFNTITEEKLKIIENCSGMNLNMYKKK
jgi:DNA-binding Lrp family transcriptional regulator